MSSKLQKTIVRQQEKYSIHQSSHPSLQTENIIELHQVPTTKPINNSVLLLRAM